MLSWLIILPLLVFTFRRVILTLGAVSHKKSLRIWSADPSAFRVLVCIPARNEATTLSPLLEALSEMITLDGTVDLVLLNDASTDNTQLVFDEYAADRSNWKSISVDELVGKASLLNLALHTFPAYEILVVFDADDRPEKNALAYLLSAFDDPKVGAVSGRRRVDIGIGAWSARYTALEANIHQNITMRGKANLNLFPAILGSNCAYRRAALASIGDFIPNSLLEDSHITLQTALGGWETRFVPEAIATQTAPQSLGAYWRQHVRWGVGFNQIAGAHVWKILRAKSLHWLQRLELTLFSLGYLDRVFVLGAGVWLGFVNWEPFLALVLGFHLFFPFVQVIVSFWIEKRPWLAWLDIFVLPVFYLIDLSAAVYSAFWHGILKRPVVWETRS